jgi:hypothetical protein
MSITHRTGAPAGDAKADHIAAKEAPPGKREELIDEAVEETFPASDPPSFMGGAATGGPRQSTVVQSGTKTPRQ